MSKESVLEFMKEYSIKNLGLLSTENLQDLADCDYIIHKAGEFEHYFISLQPKARWKPSHAFCNLFNTYLPDMDRCNKCESKIRTQGKELKSVSISMVFEKEK